MISFEKARDTILENVGTFGVEHVPLAAALGRVLAEDLTAPFDQPLWDNSQVDGYALRATDAELDLTVVGESAAGAGELPRVAPRQAVRIFTGARIPPGADAVAMQEDVEVTGGGIRILEPVGEGMNIRRQGEEIATGAQLPLAGKVIDPALIGFAATIGMAELPVFRRPRVALVATGNELVPVGRNLAKGEVYASNVHAFIAALAALGIEPAHLEIAHDDPVSTEKALQVEIESADVTITLGGISVGDHDLVRSTLQKLQVEEIFWRVAMKPGKPFYFGRQGEKWIFGLPGNPVSALVTYLVLVQPALRKMMGDDRPAHEFEVELATPIHRRDARYEFLRATLEGRIATPVEHQGSHMQSGLVGADALLHLPEGVEAFEAGQILRATPIRWSPL